ncbi:hypothetical protein B3C1_17702 [Gallaecimonas xiamenensis 3-C-1]|uniref:Uncharacterized protein n=1 Tax=Gallaecimonas xiamenensis 3-C-1 TaxID=745411 RepID=K2JRS7_9GAMM|nr:hypothetical protein B3C1_17702 [Gallaecimonas xiamenensis 3-C-1]
MDQDELDRILDSRDEDQFDTAWIELHQSTSGIDVPFENRELFLKLSKATSCHEICSYISDDFELISKAEALGIESAFLNYLKCSYEQGLVPSEWQG